MRNICIFECCKCVMNLFGFSKMFVYNTNHLCAAKIYKTNHQRFKDKTVAHEINIANHQNIKDRIVANFKSRGLKVLSLEKPCLCHLFGVNLSSEKPFSPNFSPVWKKFLLLNFERLESVKSGKKS